MGVLVGSVQITVLLYNIRLCGNFTLVGHTQEYSVHSVAKTRLGKGYTSHTLRPVQSPSTVLLQAH